MALEPKGKILFSPILETRPGETIKPGDIAHIPAAPPPEAGTLPTIDAIIRRTREASYRWHQRQGTETPFSPASEQAREEELAARERDLRSREYALAERLRELEEDRMLLQAREQQCQRRMALAHREPASDSDQVEDLKRTVLALKRRNVELEEALTLTTKVDNEAADEPSGLDIMAEREAFIEESENALFEKAMALQELETQLDHVMDELKAVAERLGADWQALAGSLTLPHSGRESTEE